MYILCQSLLLKFIYFFITIQLYFIQKSHGNQINCTPSSCGKFRNISYPWRLMTDPKRCGHPEFELLCENNTTSIYIDSLKYLVHEINSTKETIRLAIPNVTIIESCSFPKYPLLDYMFFVQNSVPIIFMSCPYSVNGSKLLEITSHCADKKLYGVNGSRAYIMFGTDLHQVKDMCKIDLVVMTSLPLKIEENVSFSTMHKALLYGFDVPWFLPLNYICVYSPWPIGGYHRIMFCGDFPAWLADAFQWIVDNLWRSIALILMSSLALRIVIGMPCMLGFLIYKFRRRHLSMFDVIEGFLQSNTNLKTIRYTYSDMKKITKGFREKLGQGGYGSVYKGKLRSGHDVAVKVLAKPSSNGQDFINEVATIGRIHHVNVVKLVGYCAERSKRALVYDFMPNGSLEKYIFNKEKGNSLNLKRKYEIAIGVARGIEYLHRGCDIQILHFDIKPHNILLDENFTPKISDFGLAKFYSTDNTTVTLTAVRGTIGYVAPELINRSIGGVSYKADVYSFGMLLMEMLGLNKGTGPNIENKSTQYFPCWIYDHLNKGEDIEIGNVYENNDDEDKEDDDDGKKMRRKMTIVGLWCIQMSPTDRPSMSEVLKMLEGEDENMMIPPQPSQSSEIPSYDDQTWGTKSESTGSVALLRNDSLSFQ
ncbi:hypothetical protein ABFX02_05G085700 [Erythranthe guttata]